MADIRAYAKAQNVAYATDNTWKNLRATRDGAPVVAPWLAQLVIEGKAYQVRLGTIATALTSDVLITNTFAESAAEAATGFTIMPLRLNVDIAALGGTLPQVCFKSVGALITTLGAAFVPLNLKIGGPAASGRAAVSAAGGVTVASEVLTTTRIIFAATQAVAANNYLNVDFALPPVLVGPASCYLQVGSVTTGSEYFGNYDFAEFVGTEVG
jgi:hypothetical protein